MQNNSVNSQQEQAPGAAAMQLPVAGSLKLILESLKAQTA